MSQIADSDFSIDNLLCVILQAFYKTEAMKINVNGQQVEAYALLMQKENALDILSGKKTIEIRALNSKYDQMFTDHKQLELNEELRKAGRANECKAPYRTDVGYIHFYNYNKSWTLDVAIDEIGMTEMTKAGIEFLNKEFDFHDYDNEWQQYEGVPDDEIPLFYYLHIVEVVGQTGLK